MHSIQTKAGQVGEVAGSEGGPFCDVIMNICQQLDLMTLFIVRNTSRLGTTVWLLMYTGTLKELLKQQKPKLVTLKV